MGLLNIKSILVLFLLLNFQVLKSQTIANTNPCPKSKLLKDLRKFVLFCNDKFSSSNYFQSDSICTNCIKKDFKKFRFEKIDKFGEIFQISFEKDYSKRSVNFLNIYLALNSLNKNSSSISFYPYSTNINFSTSCISDVLGTPMGHNSDSTSIFWVTNLKNVFELRLEKMDLVFYTKGYEDKYFDFINNKEITTPIAERIVDNSLPKLPIISDLTKELKSNDYFYEDNIFSDNEKKEFGINFFKFCKQDFDDLTNEFVLHKRESKEFNSAIDSLKNQCFKKENLFRGSSIRIYNYANQNKRANQIAFSIACFKRPSDTDESIKKERIKNTLNYLIENSRTDLFLQNTREILIDFIDSIEIDKERTFRIEKDNYLISILYQKDWLTVFITMPKAYTKE